MTKKDYVMLASVFGALRNDLRKATDANGLKYFDSKFIGGLADKLEADNPSFRRDLFVLAVLSECNDK